MVARHLPVPNGTASCFIGWPAGLLRGSDGLVVCGGAGLAVLVVDGVGVGVDGCPPGRSALPHEMASTETAASASTGTALRRIFLAGKDIWSQKLLMMIISRLSAPIGFAESPGQSAGLPSPVVWMSIATM